jgi:diguanylate cyclase (GGDEF)-like protein
MTAAGGEQTDIAASGSLGVRARAFLRTGNEAYEGGDVRLSRKVGAAVLVISASIIVGLVAVAPPTARIGALGWLPATFALSVSALFVWRLVSPGSVVGFGELYAVSLTGITQVALFQWLAGAHGSPYHELFLLWAVYTGTVHSPRRVVAFLAILFALGVGVLMYDGFDGVALADFGVQFLIWAALTTLGSIFTLNVRRQRIRAHSDEQQAQQLARVDALTGLGNRRAFDEALEREVARARRSGAPLSVVVGDLDGFKCINDRFGHLNGDQCLKASAGAIREVVRVPDSCFRWGGDEFAVLLPETELLGGKRVAERMRQAVTELCSAPDGMPLTLACGTAELCDDMESSDLLAAADLALMTLKSARGTESAT